MSKINDNGVIREMTEEEVAEYERKEASVPPPDPTHEERLAKLEEENQHLKEALNLLLMGVTEDA